MKTLAFDVAAAFGVPLLILCVAAFAGNIVQHRIVFTTESVKPQLSRISPMAGSLGVLAPGAGGISPRASSSAPWSAASWRCCCGRNASGWEHRHSRSGDDAAVYPLDRAEAARGGRRGARSGRHRRRSVPISAWYQRQKMSLQEIKEEFRQTEGDPTIKGKLRQLRMTRMRKRIIAAVPKASLVITNPTHYAIALKYERGMNAPICVAKGVDLIARQIREVAEEHRIPVVENPPLARALHATVEIDQEIPQEHYRAVAEIIGYIMRARRTAAERRPL